jgi:hypothetical protein
MINKKKVARILPSVGWWLFLLSGPASDYFRNAPARRVTIAVVGWVAFGLFITAIVIGYSEIKKPRAGVVLYGLGFALLMTSTLIGSYGIVFFCVGLALMPVSLIWMMAPQIHAAFNRLRSDYHKLSQQ